MKCAEILDSLARYYGADVFLKIGENLRPLSGFEFDADKNILVFEALTLWDSFRELCDEHKGASLPRDVFENWLDNINDLAIEALAEMEGIPKRESGDQLLKNLSMLVIRLSHRLSLREDGKAMAAQAMDFLQRNGLQGSPLRTDIEDDKTNKNATSAEHYKRESVECVKALSAIEDLIAEYLHWRKVNPQIKGGENYLKRLREALVYSQVNRKRRVK